MIRSFRRHLFWKIFLSCLVIIFVWLAVLAFATPFSLRSAFSHHMNPMMGMGDDHGMMGSMMSANLYPAFRNAAMEAIRVATVAALFASLLVSGVISRQLVSPVKRMKMAAQRIADGHYYERVEIPAGLEEGEMNELNQLAYQFNQMASRLEQTEEMRRQLIGDVSHEMRTPLTTIQGTAEGLLDGVLPSNPDTYQLIYQEADRLKRLAADLQELSRVEVGEYEALFEPVFPRILVDTVMGRLERQYEDKGVRLDAEMPDDLPMVQADMERIGQVLLNLVGNALQYAPAGGEVKVVVHQKGSEVQFDIIDNGIGIEPEHLPHLFTRFYRVDKSRSRVGGGSGIGLTIARHLAEAHGGRIWASSRGLGEGSTFSFTLPVSRPAKATN